MREKEERSSREGRERKKKKKVLFCVYYALDSCEVQCVQEKRVGEIRLVVSLHNVTDKKTHSFQGFMEKERGKVGRQD